MSLFKAINRGLGQMLKYPNPIGEGLGWTVSAMLFLYVGYMVGCLVWGGR